MPDTAVQIVPSVQRVKSTATSGLKGGVVGGLVVSIASLFLGPVLGKIAGGIGSGAMLGGSTGEIIAVTAIYDGVLSMFAGLGAAGSGAGANMEEM